MTTEQAVLVGAAGVTAFAVHAPWFLALGAAGSAILAWNRLQHERAKRAGELPFPSCNGLGPAATKAMIDGHRAAQAVLDEIAEGPDFVRNLFASAEASIRGLFEKLTTLVRRHVEIERYLAKLDPARLEHEWKTLTEKARKADDDAAREQYLAAARSTRETIDAGEGLARDARRIDAQVAAIRAGFENARAKVVRVKTVEARGGGADSEAVVSALATLGNEVDALTSAVDEVFSKAQQRSVEFQDKRTPKLREREGL
jgi:hypothetical protein